VVATRRAKIAATTAKRAILLVLLMVELGKNLEKIGV
jgi:hypothetical protein